METELRLILDNLCLRGRVRLVRSNRKGRNNDEMWRFFDETQAFLKCNPAGDWID